MNKENLEQLKENLEEYERYSLILKQKRKEFEDSIRDEILDPLEQFKEQISLLKANISEEAVLEYKEKGIKKLLGGIGIRVGTILDYDKKDAYSWAEKHKLFLKLDDKGFEKYAKDNEIDFVEKSDKITVTYPKIINLD